MPLDMTDSLIFTHKKNINLGFARVIYEPYPGGNRPPGWALPGGRITPNEAEAMDAARLIDRLTLENKRP